MQFKDIIYAIAHFFEWAFHILPVFGNIPNLIILVIMIVLFFYWMSRMFKYRKTGDA